MNNLSNLLTTKEVADYTGLALTTVRMYLWAKKLPSIRIGVQDFVRKSDVDRWLAERLSRTDGRLKDWPGKAVG